MIAQPEIYHCEHCNKDFIGLQNDMQGSLKCRCPQCGKLCSPPGILNKLRSYLSMDMN